MGYLQSWVNPCTALFITRNEMSQRFEFARRLLIFTPVCLPLAFTTAKTVIGNLTRSLNSHLCNGGSRRQVVLATSQPLTQRRRHNLEKRAEEKEFVLVQA